MPPARDKKSQELQKRICSVSFQVERCEGVWEKLARPEHCDLSFVCGDEVRVSCHQTVLALASTHLHQLFRTSGVRTGGEDRLEVSLPEVRSDVLLRILSLLYCGLMEVEGKTMLKEIKFVWNKILQIDIVKLNNREDMEVLLPGQEKKIQGKNHILKNMIPISNGLQEENSIIENSPVSSELEVQKDKGDNPTSNHENIKPVVDRLIAEDDGAHKIMMAPSQDIKRKRDNFDQSEMAQKSESQQKKKKMKTTKTAASYSVEEIHTCLICNGRTPEGRIDKQASDLSFADPKIKKLKEHYSKHFYKEGRILRAFPPEKNNIDVDGNIIDEFGKQFIYKCEEENCWKSKTKKQGFGYKEIALHHSAEHGLFEKIASCDEREKVRNLLQHIKLTVSHNSNNG